MVLKRLNKLLLLSLSICWLSIQPCKTQDKGCTYLDKVKPAVFLSLVKEHKDDEKIYLRITNNSTCLLQVETDDYMTTPDYEKYRKEIERKQLPNGNTEVKYIYQPPDGTQVLIFYDIRPQTDSIDRPANYWEGRDMIFYLTIPPGRNFIFPVKAEHFRQKYGISVPFYYEWENNRELSVLGTITHRVRYIYELPDGY